MMKKPQVTTIQVTTIILTAVSIFLFANIISAQQVIFDEKKALIQEFRELTSISKFSISIKTQEISFQEPFSALAENDAELSDSQKKEIKAASLEAKERITKEMQVFSEQPETDILYETFSIQTVADTFREDEIKEVGVFLRTVAGKKTTKFLMNFKDSLKNDFGKFYENHLKTVLTKKLEEETNRIKQKIADMKVKRLVVEI